MIKNPRQPARPLTFEEDDFIDWPGGLLFRIHRAAGAHPMAWNSLRAYGPTASRWDPHPPPVGHHPDMGIAYAASDVTTALAEVFQERRLIDPVSGAPQLTAWQPQGKLTLLDMNSNWAVRNGASASLPSASRSTCRAWSRAIRLARPELAGLVYRSTMANGQCVALFTPSLPTFPSAPSFSRPLDHPAVRSVVDHAAAQIGYRAL